MSKKPPPKLSRGLSMAQFMSSVDTTQLASIKALWSQLDSSGKGLVSANDLSVVMLSVDVDASYAEVTSLVKELDSDGDGKISFKDFYNGVLRKQQPGENEKTNNSLRPHSPNPSSLLRPDSPNPPLRSSSPSIPKSPALSPSLPKSPSPTPAKPSSLSAPSSPAPVAPKINPAHNQFTQTAKKEASPKIEKRYEPFNPQSKNENRCESPNPQSKFIRSPSLVQFVKHLTGPQLSEMQTLFNHYDKDRDGRIALADVQAIVTEINPSIDISELLRTIDADRDGNVNFKEFIDGVVMVYRTNKKQAEKLTKEAIAEPGSITPPVNKKVLKQTIAKLQDDITLKDVTIEQLRKQVSDLQRENTKLKEDIKKR